MQVYSFILKSGIPFFPLYGLIFLYAGNIMLFLSTFIFSGVCIALLMRKELNINRIMLLAHLQIISIIIMVVCFGGWAYGIQYILFATIALSYLTHHKNAAIPVVSVYIEAIIFIVLYFLYAQKEPTIVMPDIFMKFYFIASVLIGVTITLITGRKVQISTYIYNSIILEENQALRELADTDALTSALNRRAMQLALENSWDRYVKNGENFWLIMSDVDLFKEINDNYGHDAGDEAIKHIVDSIYKNIRDIDVVSRWGGDEFLIMLSDIEEKDAIEKLLNRISESINEPPFKYKGKEIRIDMTFGCAFSANHDSLREILLRADTNLYEGKRHRDKKIVF